MPLGERPGFARQRCPYLRFLVYPSTPSSLLGKDAVRRPRQSTRARRGIFCCKPVSARTQRLAIGGGVTIGIAVDKFDYRRGYKIQPIDAAIQSNMRDITSRVLASLMPREERIVRMRFGIGINGDHTLKQVGQQFSVTRERIRQIEAKALRTQTPESIRYATEFSQMKYERLRLQCVTISGPAPRRDLANRPQRHEQTAASWLAGGR
jgi:RNA polymerase sigma factor (sigma-70 family)